MGTDCPAYYRRAKELYIQKIRQGTSDILYVKKNTCLHENVQGRYLMKTANTERTRKNGKCFKEKRL